LKRALTRAALCAAALLTIGLASCVSGFDRNDQMVNSLRILGAAAHIDSGDGVDWADAQVGDTVTFSALIANPTGVPGVTVTWVTCLPSLNNTVTPCDSETVLRQPTDLITMAADPASGVILLGVGETIQYVVPQEVQPLLDALIANADQHVNAQCSVFKEAPVIIIAQGSDNSVVSAVKNLRLAPWSQTGPDAPDPRLQHYIRNANPGITALNVPNDKSACVGQTLVASCQSAADCGGAPATCSPEGWCPAVPFPADPQTITICGRIPDADSQTYYYCGLDGVDGSELEYPSITWYETAGTEAGISNSNTAGTPDLPSRTFQNITRPMGSFTLYGVVRDGRDGENWIAQDFQ
jgi:hypothetical protein